MTDSVRHAVVLVAHGSRDPQWAAPLKRVEAQLQERMPQLDVRVAFLEYIAPAVDAAIRQAISEGATRLTLAPLLLGAGAHARNDIARLVAQVQHEYPEVSVGTLAIIGEMDVVVNAIVTGLIEALNR